MKKIGKAAVTAFLAGLLTAGIMGSPAVSAADNSGENLVGVSDTAAAPTTEAGNILPPNISKPGSSSGSAFTTASNGHKVAIDPGHQGNWIDMSDPEPVAPGSSETKARATTGTTGVYSGLNEFELNLQVSLLLKEELIKRGYEVVMTREDNDANISNMERAQLAANEGAEILVRIHANGSDDHSVNGALVMVPSPENPYVGHLYSQCYSLGENILNAYCAGTGFASLGIQYYDNMSGINWSTIPVTILEMGFMSNESDDLTMADSSFWPVMAEGVANGIDSYFAQ
ncbi:MAG: N-acetylmuramoyl-L-alanine amidase [Eubacteriales bacterium]|nr:N-acetylmuramoyl-L-alanine amidase [Eubacteriales bacterium]